MQETSNYNLKKPEPTDPLRLEDFNENADIIDGAIKAVERSVAGAYGPNNLPWVTGSLNLTNVDEGDVAKTFSFAPSAIFLTGASVTPGFGLNGDEIDLEERTDSSSRTMMLNGKTLTVTGIYGGPSEQLRYLALR